MFRSGLSYSSFPSLAVSLCIAFIRPANLYSQGRKLYYNICDRGKCGNCAKGDGEEFFKDGDGGEKTTSPIEHLVTLRGRKDVM